MNEFLTDKAAAELAHQAAIKSEEAELERETLLEFPCEFPIKIMGPATADFDAEIRAIARVHVGEVPESAWRIRQSAKGNFVGMTLTFTATSKPQIDNLYRAITAHPDVKMCL
ncbi:MAG: YbeD family protein [Halothiobacillus sp.]